MKTAGIVIDSYKLGIFKKHLDAAGYKYTVHPKVADGEVMPSILTIKIQYEWVAKLKPIVEAAQKECVNAKH